MDHMLELVAAAGEFSKCLADRHLPAIDVIGLAATHFVGSGGVGGQAVGIRGVGLGLGADQLAIGLEARWCGRSRPEARPPQAFTSGFS